jgi:dipeptidyl aminopeptidase/acylaminoacyl peptidase
MGKRAIDLLQAQPDVDPDRIGVVGLSNGGVTTMFLTAMDDRIKLAVASGDLIMHQRMWHKNFIHFLHMHCRCQYLYKLDGVLDYYDIFALIAPRPLVVQSGEKDGMFPIESAKQAYVFIEQAYQIAGVPDKVTHDVHPLAHVFVAEVPLAWFQKYLPLPGEN